MTISANGVTKYSPDEMIFTPIELWEREYKDYLKIAKVNFNFIINLHFLFYLFMKFNENFYLYFRSKLSRFFARGKLFTFGESQYHGENIIKRGIIYWKIFL